MFWPDFDVILTSNVQFVRIIIITFTKYISVFYWPRRFLLEHLIISHQSEQAFFLLNTRTIIVCGKKNRYIQSPVSLIDLQKLSVMIYQKSFI